MCSLSARSWDNTWVYDCLVEAARVGGPMLNVLGTFACGHVGRVFREGAIYSIAPCSFCRKAEAGSAFSSLKRRSWSLQLATPSLADHSPPPPDLGRSGRTK